MKVFSKLIYCVIMSLQFSLILSMATAQNSHECFMLDSDGNPIDLGYLCGGSQNNAHTSTIKTKKSITSNLQADHFVIPIKRRVGGTPVVEVKFNDKYVFDMLFDTGATMTVVTESMAHKLKLKSMGSLPFQTASNNLIYFKTSRISSAIAGNMEVNNLNIAVAPTIDMGLLGQNFFGTYDITIKYDTIEFRRR